MQSAHERRHHPADHDVMKMRDDKISAMHMHIHRERREKKSGESADDKKPDERKARKASALQTKLSRDISVIVQLKTFIAEGIATRKLKMEKTMPA